MGDDLTFVVRSRRGYENLISTLGNLPSVLWVAAGVFAPEEIIELKGHGVDIRTLPSYESGGGEDGFLSLARGVVARHPSKCSVFCEVLTTD
jgi:hypothetical protein